MSAANVRDASRARTNGVVGGFGAALAITGFVIGVPVALLGDGAGSPLALLIRLVESPARLVGALERPVSDSTVLHVVTLAAWSGWLWLLACLVAEVTARLRGRPAQRLPGSRHGQALAALTVGACLLLIPSVRAQQSIRIAGDPRAVAVPRITGLVDVTLASRAVPVSGTSATCAPSTAPTTRAANAPVEAAGAYASGGTPGSYVVRPGDTLWSIAGRELGSPLRWREIAEINMGRPQPDGRALENAGWILPGWVLELPAPSGAPSQASAHVSSGGAARSKRAESVFPLGASRPPPSKSPKSAPPGSGLSARSPSTTVNEPSSTGSKDSTGSTGATGSTGPTGSSSAADPTHGVSAAGDRQSDSETRRETDKSAVPVRRPSIPLAPFGYGILGAGVVTVLNRLRRAQQRHRREGMRIAMPGPELQEAEQLLRWSADLESATWVDSCLRLLVASCRDHVVRPPSVVAVRVLERAVELLVDDPRDVAVPPFESHGSRSSWFLPKSPELLESAHSDARIAGIDVITPALVTLGTAPDGLFLWDLEQTGSAAVAGESADDVLRAMAVELATSSWCDQANVILVGDGPDDFSGSREPSLAVLDRVRAVGDLVEVLPESRHVVSERTLMLDAVGFERTSDARFAMSGDGWDVSIVFCFSRCVQRQGRAVSEIVSLAGDGAHGLAVVCAGPVDGTRWSVEVGSGPVRLRMSDRNDSMIWPQKLHDDESSRLAKIIEVANQLDGVAPQDEPDGELPSEPGSDAHASPAVEIRVLGPVEVVGAARSFTRAWSLELVVYLAMHRGGATTDQWSTHLWPNRAMAPASLHSTASAARRALGSNADGEDHLPRSHGRLTLGPDVGTDWEEFKRLSASSDPASWRRALGLIRGLPFDGLRSTDWAVFSHVQANIESHVVDVACRTCEHFLRVNEPGEAEWAARRGLLVSPYDERLFRILMRAAYAAGNLAGVDAAFSELVQLVGGEVEPYDSVHPETYELYKQLSRKHVPAPRR